MSCMLGQSRRDVVQDLMGLGPGGREGAGVEEWVYQKKNVENPADIRPSLVVSDIYDF